MDEPTQHNWTPCSRRVRPVHGRHAASDLGRHFFKHDDFSVHCVRVGAREVVAARGQLVVTSAWQLERELRRAEATDAFEILLDLAGLKFVDTVGIEVVTHACARARYHSKRLMIGPASEAVQRMFERGGLASPVSCAAALS